VINLKHGVVLAKHHAMIPRAAEM